MSGQYISSHGTRGTQTLHSITNPMPSNPLTRKLQHIIKKYPLTLGHITCTIGLSLLNSIQPVPSFLSPFLASPSFLIYALVPFAHALSSIESTSIKPSKSSGLLKSTHKPLMLLYSALLAVTIFDSISTGNLHGFILIDCTVRFIESFMGDTPALISGVKIHPLLFASGYAMVCGKLWKSLALSVGVSYFFRMDRKQGGSVWEYVSGLTRQFGEWVVSIWTAVDDDNINRYDMFTF